MTMRKNNSLILGLTGGIACGKSTVADMLQELGAETIDFDLLARQVVEPGKAALKRIAEYFGADILQKDGNLDRKKLSKIVFQDKEKRRILESFTHPAINGEYFRQVNAVAEKSPIIQAVIPLLFEFNLQDMADKILVVYIPREKQIERLALRDGISASEAARMVDTQMPVEEKVRRADFVIRNDGDIEDTRRHIRTLWKSLRSEL
jgi:dephospho-CoA kinase